VDRHFQGDAGTGADAQEIDMQREVAHWVELVVAGDHLERLALDLDFDDVAEETAGIDFQLGFLVRNRDGEGGLLVAVDDSGNKTLAAQFARGALANPFACRRLEGSGDCMLPSKKVARDGTRGRRAGKTDRHADPLVGTWKALGATT